MESMIHAGEPSYCDWARSIAEAVGSGSLSIVGSAEESERMHVIEGMLASTCQELRFQLVELPALPWAQPPLLGSGITQRLLSSDHLLVVDNMGKDPILSWLNMLPWSRFPKLWVAGEGHHRVELRIAESFEQGNPVPSLAMGYPMAKAHIYEVLRHLSSRHRTGCVLEMGVFRGGTLLMMRKMLDHLGMHRVELIGFDTFGGFPTPTCLLDQYASSAFENLDYDGTLAMFKGLDIRLIRGDIRATIQNFYRSDILLTFFDTDNYSPAHNALPICWQGTVDGGAVIFDHYHSSEELNGTIGERVAAVDFFKGRIDALHLSGTGVFIKMPARAVERKPMT